MSYLREARGKAFEGIALDMSWGSLSSPAWCTHSALSFSFAYMLRVVMPSMGSLMRYVLWLRCIGQLLTDVLLMTDTVDCSSYCEFMHSLMPSFKRSWISLGNCIQLNHHPSWPATYAGIQFQPRTNQRIVTSLETGKSSSSISSWPTESYYTDRHGKWYRCLYQW